MILSSIKPKTCEKWHILAKKVGFLLFFCLFLMPFACALQQNSDGLVIVSPESTAYKLSDVITLQFAVYNSTSSRLNGSDADCVFTLYDLNGTTILDSSLNESEQSFFVKILNDSLPSGVNTYLVSCNSSAQNGFIASSFKVNHNGRDDVASGGVLVAIVLAPLVLSLLLLIGGMNLNSERHGVVKIFIFLLSIIPYWASMHFGVLVLSRYYDLLELQVAMSDSVFWTGLVFFTLVSYFMIYMLVRMFGRIATNEEHKLEY